MRKLITNSLLCRGEKLLATLTHESYNILGSSILCGMSKVLPLTVSLFMEIAGFNCASLERNLDLQFQQPRELILPLTQLPIASQ